MMKNLEHLNDFDFSSEGLGRLRIGALPSESRKQVQNKVSSFNVNAADVARSVFDQVAHLITDDLAVDEVCGGPLVQPGAANRLTDAELGKFAEEYGGRFFGHWKREASAEGQPTGVDYLVFQIRATNRAQQERLAKFQADVNRLHSSPAMKAIREAQKLKDMLFPPHVVAMQNALELTNRWDEIQRINAPFEDLRRRLEGIDGWKGLLTSRHGYNSVLEKINESIRANVGFTSALKALQISDSWKSSIEHARNSYAHQSVVEALTRSQRNFHDIQRRWKLPNELVQSVGALSALQEQIGRLTLPTLDWLSAAELVRALGADGIQAQLSELGIDEQGALQDSEPEGESRLFSPMRQDLLALLSLIVGILFFIYQEQSSGKWQDNVDSKLDSHTVALAEQAKKFESLSVLVERALVKETRVTNTRFVVLERGSIIYRKPESGAQLDGKLFPREVVSLVSEKGKWIEVRYYNWRSREYATGWVLKKYFTRVPPSRQLEE